MLQTFICMMYLCFFLYAVIPAQTIGSSLHGTIDEKFDGGYIVTVDLGSQQLKGVLYHVSSNVSQSSYAKGKPISKNRNKSRLSLSDPSRSKSNKNVTNSFLNAGLSGERVER